MTATKANGAALFLHGAGGGGWEWNLWRSAFAARGRASDVLELQAAAGGLAATGFHDYLAQATTAAARMTRPVLIGASLGGLLAWCAAERIDCSALVLVNPVPPLPEAADWPGAMPEGAVLPWRQCADLASTRRAMAGADDAAAIYAFRRWRDESATVLREVRRGIAATAPACPLLVIANDDDVDVPAALSAGLAQRCGASLLRLPGDHLEALLGRSANRTAALAVEWLNGLEGFRTD